LGCPQLDLIRTGFSLNRRPQSYLAFKLREIDFELVLHRPVETTAVTGKAGSLTQLPDSL
jgi:hypothetical protein